MIYNNVFYLCILLFHATQNMSRWLQKFANLCVSERDLGRKFWSMGIISVVCRLNHFISQKIYKNENVHYWQNKSYFLLSLKNYPLI